MKYNHALDPLCIDAQHRSKPVQENNSSLWYFPGGKQFRKHCFQSFQESKKKKNHRKSTSIRTIKDRFIITSCNTVSKSNRIIFLELEVQFRSFTVVSQQNVLLSVHLAFNFSFINSYIISMYQHGLRSKCNPLLVGNNSSISKSLCFISDMML